MAHAYQNTLDLSSLWLKHHNTENMDVVSLGAAISDLLIENGFSAIYSELDELIGFFKRVKTIEYFDELVDTLLAWGEEVTGNPGYNRQVKKCKITI